MRNNLSTNFNILCEEIRSTHKALPFIRTEFTGVTLVNNTIQVQLHKAL